MSKQFISDYVTKDVVDRWDIPNDIKIFGETGSGKTYWVVNTLAPQCREKGYKILYLAHRSSLQKQMEQDTIAHSVDDVVEVKTYQSIITQFKLGALNLLKYDVIIFDEYQFLVNDSDFIADTEIIYQLIKLETDHIKIFLTANDLNIGISFDCVYEIGETSYDISNRVESAYSVPNTHHFKGIIEEILTETGDKVFCYVNDNKLISELLDEFKDDIALYVSESSPLSKYMDTDEIRNLAINNKVGKRILLSTSAIDAGVSIIDTDVKHIIAEERDLDKLYQVIGRVRIVNNGTFNLYIADYHPSRLGGYKTQITKQLQLIDMFNSNPDEFFRLYGRENLSNTIFYTDVCGNLKVNKMAEMNLKNLLEQIELYLEFGYVEILEDEFGVEFEDMYKLKQQETLSEYLDSIVGKVMLQPKDRKELIEKMNVRSNGKLLKSRTSLNSALEECNLPYTIRQFKTSRTENGVRKQYSYAWEVLKLTGNN